MMEPALHSWSCRQRFAAGGFTAHDFITLAADCGFHAVELMTGKAGQVQHITSEEPDYLDGLVRFAAGKGVRIACWSTYNDFSFVPNEEWRQANIAYIQRWLGIAGRTGVPNIRMLTGYRVKGTGDKRLEGLVLDGIRSCVPFAEQAGVNMAVENHNHYFMEADDLLWLFAEIGSPRLTACPDPSNWVDRAFLEGKADDRQREVVFANLAKIAHRATESHFKVLGFDAEGRILGWGADLDRLTGIFREAGYTGCLAIEYIGEGTLEVDLVRARTILEASLSRLSQEIPS